MLGIKKDIPNKMNLLALISFGFILLGVQHVRTDEIDATKHKTPVICYVGAWARYRTAEGFFDATSFNPKLCTHVIYSFAGLSNSTHEMISLDPTAELNSNEGGKDGFRSYVNLKQKNPQLKVLIAVGGWTEGSEKYSAMASLPERRKVFVNSVIDFLTKYKFDGLDIDWEYPTKRGGRPEDRNNFSALLKELKEAFRKNNPSWIMSIAVAAGKYILDEAYDFPEIVKYTDFVSVMTYDYHGKWENKTGHNSPLYHRKNGDDALTNVNYTINYLVQLGVVEDKLVLGLPFYGRTYTLDDHKQHTVGSPAHEPGQKGRYTQEANFMGYNEICQEISKPSWKKLTDEEQRVPYAYEGKSWVGYDDKASIVEKVKYSIKRGLHGVMIWSIDTDDVIGTCHDSPMYLLKAINTVYAEKYVEYNIVQEEETNETPKKANSAVASSIQSSLPVWMILSSWVLHVVKQKLDVIG